MAQKPKYDNFYTPQNDEFYKTFEYPPLDTRYNEIRLLQIDTTGRGDHHMIPRVPLDRASSYSALSYYSGSPSKTQPLNIDGVTFNAFANTVAALEETIRSWNSLFPGERLILWTDQVCINQSDPDEKSQQVNFMREIYRRADRVFLSMLLIRDISPALDWLRRRPSRKATKSIAPRNEQHNHSNRMVYQRNLESETEDPSPLDPRFPAASWDLMYDILEHPWWTRSWVYQEFIMASRAIFLFAHNNWLDWEEFHPLLIHFLDLSVPEHLKACQRHCDRSTKQNKRMDSWLGSEQGRQRSSTGTILSAVGYCCGCFAELSDVSKLQSHMARLRRKSIARSLVTYVLSSKLQWPGQPVELSYLLRHARNTQSSQSKDKIYAFLGLTHTRYGIPIRYQPSYTINALLTDTARSIITREASRLNILVDAGTSVPNRQLTSSTDPLPSWVSDWTSSRSERHDDFIEALGFPPNCTAGSHPQGKVESYLAQFEADAFGNPARILVVNGILVATLSSILADNVFQAWRSYGTTSGIVTATTCSIAQADDEVWIVSSVKWPLVMRREKIGTMVLLGPAMLHDARSGTVSPIMTGHGLDQREQYWQPLKLS